MSKQKSAGESRPVHQGDAKEGLGRNTFMRTDHKGRSTARPTETLAKHTNVNKEKESEAFSYLREEEGLSEIEIKELQEYEGYALSLMAGWLREGKKIIRSGRLADKPKKREGR